MPMSASPRTMFQKVWEAHVVATLPSGEDLIYIDRHLLNEVTSPQAFDGLRLAGRGVLRPQATIAVADHNVPTENRHLPIADPDSRLQVDTLERNVAEFGIPYIPLRSNTQGIVHVVGPELGLTLPGMIIVCGDSHTSTHGAFGALAFGIGTSEAEHVLATQSLVQTRARNMLVRVNGVLAPGICAKDLILAIIGQIGTSGAAGHVVEYSGSAIRNLDMAGRMTICNMSIEAGARAGMIAPDETTFDYLKGRQFAPSGAEFEQARSQWLELASDDGARFDSTVEFDAGATGPMVTWGTSPDAVVSISEVVPNPDDMPDPARREAARKMLSYMDLQPGTRMSDIQIDAVFIGSCTNSRIEDLRIAAKTIAGRMVSPNVRAMVVPGSGSVKAQAEAEGLDQIFIESGFSWRESGCSMCLGMNPDRLRPGERCASTSNRNFEGRQGPGSRTHLMSPAMAAAAAVAGRLTDIRVFG